MFEYFLQEQLVAHPSSLAGGRLHPCRDFSGLCACSSMSAKACTGQRDHIHHTEDDEHGVIQCIETQAGGERATGNGLTTTRICTPQDGGMNCLPVLLM